jgi:uncharacterized protein (DUF1697 family)
MALVAFLRGVNVGGNRKFSPKELCEKMGMINIGAAGTFVARARLVVSALRDEIAKRLSFRTDILIVEGKEIVEMVKKDPFKKAEADTTRYVTILSAPPPRGVVPRLPVLVPDGDAWEAKLIGVSGRFAFSVHRRGPRGIAYPTEALKKLAETATTRNFTTILRICEHL